MTHPSDLMSAFLDGEIGPDDHAIVAAHIDGCSTCRADLDSLARVRDWIRGLPFAEPPVPLVPTLRRTSRWSWAAASAAAVALAIGLVVPSPPEPLDLDLLAGQHTARVGLAPGLSTIRGQTGGP